MLVHSRATSLEGPPIPLVLGSVLSNPTYFSLLQLFLLEGCYVDNLAS